MYLLLPTSTYLYLHPTAYSITSPCLYQLEKLRVKLWGVRHSLTHPPTAPELQLITNTNKNKALTIWWQDMCEDISMYRNTKPSVCVFVPLSGRQALALSSNRSWLVAARLVFSPELTVSGETHHHIPSPPPLVPLPPAYQPTTITTIRVRYSVYRGSIQYTLNSARPQPVVGDFLGQLWGLWWHLPRCGCSDDYIWPNWQQFTPGLSPAKT